MQALEERRAKLESDSFESPFNGTSEAIARAYREQCARVDELKRVAVLAKKIFLGED